MRKLTCQPLFFSAVISTGALSQSLLWKFPQGYADPSYLYGTIHLKDHRVLNGAIRYIPGLTSARLMPEKLTSVRRTDESRKKYGIT